MRKKILLVPAWLLLFNAHAGIISKKLYINRGSFTTVAVTTFPAYSFNSSSSFNSLNTVLQLTTSDTLLLTILNNDSITHGFDIRGLSGYMAVLAPMDSVTKSIRIASEGTWIYYDPSNYPVNRYMGLGGMICVRNPVHAGYFWNIKEHQSSYNASLAAGGNVNWNNYYPDYFTINGKSFPDLQNDTSAKITANKGDSIYIYIVNTGQSTHSIHFHGFHPTAVFASDLVQKGRSKDTWRVPPMECFVLLLVPDKKGQYSVHDHNLVAVSGGGIHPNGMFLIMDIQ